MPTEESHQSLSKLRILVTRAAHQANTFADQLRNRGAAVVEMPMLHILSPADWSKVDNCIADLPKYTWLIFASANAVEYFFDRLAAIGQDQLAKDISIATVGPATAAAVLARGHHIRYQPSTFNALAFVQEFPGTESLEDIRILCPQGNEARQAIATGLTAAGAIVDTVVCYRSQLPEDADALSQNVQQMLKQRSIDVLTLASSLTARNLQHLALLNAQDQPNLLEGLLHAIPAVTIGPETTNTAYTLGFQRVEQAEPHTTDGMISVLIRLRKELNQQ
jgi:uroporphyrinogen-III synthase